MILSEQRKAEQKRVKIPDNLYSIVAKSLNCSGGYVLNTAFSSTININVNINALLTPLHF